MVKNNQLKDGLKFVNEFNPNETIIVNFYSWVSLIKGIMVFYGKKTEEEAQSIINSSPIFITPPQNYLEACLLGHEDEYYWAMVMSNGERYFEKGFDRTAPDNYFEWEDKFINDHRLERDTLIFSD
ncbi:hypothetical protein [Serratia fonticola]